jgi:paired amphipathic helix protein Sin3a
LIHGFNTFLPPGYYLEPTSDPANPVKVTTPRDKDNTSPTPAPGPAIPEPPAVKPNWNPPPNRPAPPAVTLPPAEAPEPVPPQPPAPVNYTSQMAGASNIITSMNQSTNEQGQRMEQQSRVRGPAEFNHAINYVNKIKTRFSAQPEVYRSFLEILQTYQKDDKPINEVYQQVQQLFSSAPDLLDEFKQFLPDNSSSTSKPPSSSQGRKPSGRKPNSVAPPTHYYSQPAVQPLPPKKKPKTAKPEKLSTAEELDFFEKCKKVIGNKTTYNEFLKILNLFTQEIIEAKVLIERVEPFLGKSPELFDWFKKFVKYDEDDIIYNIPADKAPVDLRTCRQSGHSYRRMPNSIPRPACSGRDELARDVLNDDWVSTPVFISESGFVSHKKTPHEEAMYKCEEERYEFDLNIEANLSVIALLEPIAKKIMLMPVEERATFKLPPGLGGSSTTIYKRIIKKIYDSERGIEVIEALHHNPAVAVPIVLKRLKQKDEEWKRSQREWNKVWREIDAKNFSKALDHQGINFKVTDRKAILTKSLINEIEVLQLEQKEKKSTLANRYQFDFSFKNLDMFQHVDTILLSYIENTQTISSAEEEKMKGMLQDFLPKYFNLESSKQDDDGQDGNAMEVDPEVPESNGNGNLDSMEVDQTASVPVQASEQSQTIGGKRSSFALYANNALYCFFRLYQALFD